MARGGQPQGPLRVHLARAGGGRLLYTVPSVLLPGGPSSIVSRIQLLDGNQPTPPLPPRTPLPATLLPHNILRRESPTQLQQIKPTHLYRRETTIRNFPSLPQNPTPNSQTPKRSSASLPPPCRPGHPQHFQPPAPAPQLLFPGAFFLHMC